MKFYKYDKFDIKKIFFLLMILFVIVQGIIFYMFYQINKKSDQMIEHRTKLTYEITSIQYKITAAHLWFMEFLAGEVKEQTKIEVLFGEIEKSFNDLIELETKDEEVHRSKHRNDKYILNTLASLKNQFIDFKKLTNNHIANRVILVKGFDDIAYDSSYNSYISNLKEFHQRTNEMFVKVSKEFNEYKLMVYGLILMLILLSFLAFLFVIKREILKAKERVHQQELLAKQSRLADMGQMIDSIAHQWTNPLGLIIGYSDMIKCNLDNNMLDMEELKSFNNEIINQSNHLKETIQEFRSFFRPNTKKETITIKSLIDSSLLLLKDELIKNSISTEIAEDIEAKAAVNINEFKHVLINLVSNSKDAFNDKNIKNRKISFQILKEKKNIVLKVCDNAGGIPDDVIEKIFEPHFTTKEEGKGTGIGLYMAKQIIEKNNASISAKNIKDGVCFTIGFDE